MKLVLLGTTGYHPNDERHTACMMLPELGLVLDAGTAMYRVRDYLRTSELDIVLTHAHLDHIIGLTFLFDVLHEKNVGRVSVHAMPDKLAAIRTHLFNEAVFPVQPPCEFVNLEGGLPLAGGGRLSHFALEHPGGTIGLRLDWPDRSMAYVTDTTAGVDQPYVEKIRGVDLLLHECYFPDSMVEQAVLTGHSCTTPVLEVARRAGVGRLVLVHVNPLATGIDPLGLAERQAIFPNVELAHDRMEIEF